MKKQIILLTALLPLVSFAQFINKGGDVYNQKGAHIHVQGSFINGNGTTAGSVLNDGTIEVDGDFENQATASFGIFIDSTSTERVVKFTGNGTQAIKGEMNSAQASFFNLVVDKTNATDVVEMQTPVNVNGSLVFGTATTTATYQPTSLYINNNKKGLIKTYTDATEFIITVKNGNEDAIAGYASLVINGAPTSGYILTKGTRGSAEGGLQRNILSASTYVFPIGTEQNGFNAVRMNFTNIPAGGGYVIGKFNDGTDNASGAAGMLTQECFGCAAGQSAGGSGYSRYFANNPCNNNTAQWLVLEDAVIDHGYWSFATQANNNSYTYVIETFPNSFQNLGNSVDILRTVKYDDVYGANPSANIWNRFIDSVSSITDLLTYSRNTGTCYTEAGIPGGVYTGLAHFSLKSTLGGGALPVKLIFVKAEPKNNSIKVSWATALEINNSGFEVKRSEDGINFTTIGWVNGNDNSTIQQNYSFNDVNVQANIAYYYKLNQIDFDGANEDSYIVSAMINGKGGEISMGELMPNPARNASSVVVTAPMAQDITVKIFNMIGQEVSSSVFNLQAGDNALPLNIEGFASGNYNAVVYTSAQTLSKKLVVSNN